MPHIVEPNDLSLDEIEQVEKAVTRYVFQAVTDFSEDAFQIFLHSPDRPTEVGEDAMREALTRYAGFPISARIYGTMDFKRAGYFFLERFGVRQALLIDAKAEKEPRTATLQMSQTSLRVKQVRSGDEYDLPGGLPGVIDIEGNQYLTTTLFVHYFYEDLPEGRLLKAITIAALPNGRLEEKYVPNVHDTIWKAGRNAPTLGEDFRVRLSFELLKDKSKWRVQHVSIASKMKKFQGVSGVWNE